MIRISKHKRYYTNSREKKKVKRKVKKTSTKKSKFATIHDITDIDIRLAIVITKVNELVKNTNNGLGKICDALDEHERKIQHIIGSQTTMQDGIKTLTAEIFKLKAVKKEGE